MSSFDECIAGDMLDEPQLSPADRVALVLVECFFANEVVVHIHSLRNLLSVRKGRLE